MIVATQTNQVSALDAATGAVVWQKTLAPAVSGGLPRTSRLQEVSHARSHLNHLPDGPEQQARDTAFASADPLVANAWIYGYSPDAAVSESGKSRG